MFLAATPGLLSCAQDISAYARCAFLCFSPSAAVAIGFFSCYQCPSSSSCQLPDYSLHSPDPEPRHHCSTATPSNVLLTPNAPPPEHLALPKKQPGRHSALQQSPPAMDYTVTSHPVHTSWVCGLFKGLLTGRPRQVLFLCRVVGSAAASCVTHGENSKS